MEPIQVLPSFGRCSFVTRCASGLVGPLGIFPTRLSPQIERQIRLTTTTRILRRLASTTDGTNQLSCIHAPLIRQVEDQVVQFCVQLGEQVLIPVSLSLLDQFNQTVDIGSILA